MGTYEGEMVIGFGGPNSASAVPMGLQTHTVVVSTFPAYRDDWISRLAPWPYNEGYCATKGHTNISNFLTLPKVKLRTDGITEISPASLVWKV